MDEIVWKNPPAESGSKVNRVKEQLRRKPGEWALIESETDSIQIFSWWGSIYEDKDFEIRYHRKESRMFSPRDIYARYIGESS